LCRLLHFLCVSVYSSEKNLFALTLKLSSCPSLFAFYWAPVYIPPLMKLRAIALLFLSLVSAPLFSEDAPEQKMQVNLIEPSFHDGTLSTTKGGTIKGENMFLQGRKISYIRKQDPNGKPVHKIIAEGDLFFLFKGRAYTGEKIEIDVDTRTSVIQNGCTSMEPWYVGGKSIDLNADGSGIIHDGYMTTSENEKSDWTVTSPEVKLSKGSKIKAKNVQFLFIRLPFLWLPSYSTDLKHSSSSPIKYRFRWGGGLKANAGLSYEIHKSSNWKTELLADANVKKIKGGLGGGFITRYLNPNKKEKLELFNYMAHDLTTKEEGHPWLRYRFRGEYDNKLASDQIDLRVTYDKLSDQDMKSDYMNQIPSSTRIYDTQATLRHMNPNWITSLNTKIRANHFQTTKEELPLFQFNARPLVLGKSDIILANTFNAGYLDFKYANNSRHVRDYHSSRIELSQKLYRQNILGPFSITPEVGYTAIAYNNSPQHVSRNLVIGKVGCECHTSFIRNNTVLEPYANYEYYTTPTVEPHHHYLFDLNDGWHRLNQLRFGLKNFVTMPAADSAFLRKFSTDLYARAFFNTPTINRTIPRIYLDTNFKATSSTNYYIRSAWDLERKRIDHMNIGGEFTINEDAAFMVEYRTRSHYAWRKLDQENFFVDTFHSESRLRHSQLSDRRDAVLLSTFLRLHPHLSLQLRTVQGFNRPGQRSYSAYDIDIITLIRGALRLSVSLGRECAHHSQLKGWRWSIHFDLGPEKPHMSMKPRFGAVNTAN